MIAVIAENGDETAGLGSFLFEEATSRFVISGSEATTRLFSQTFSGQKRRIKIEISSCCRIDSIYT